MYIKRCLALLLSAVMALSLAGCNLEGSEENPDSQSSSSSSESTNSENGGGSSGGQENGDSQPQLSGNTLIVTDSDLYDLNKTLRSNPNITTVDFTKISAYIPTNALAGTKVNTVIVSTNTGAADGAFSGTTGLTVKVKGSGLVGGKMLEGASKVTLDLSETTIKSILSDAFSGCIGLTSIAFPASLTSVGDRAFISCSGLSSVDLSGCKNLTSIGMGAFGYCTGLKSIKLPNSLTSIGESAFTGTALTSIDLSKCTNLTRINSVFSGCTKLTSIDLSSCTSLTGIGPYAFENCASLARVTFPTGITSIDACAFQGCTSLTSIDFPASLESIGNAAFSGAGLVSANLSGCTKLTKIAESAFDGCKGLASVTFPAGLQMIWDSAFSGCTSLTSVAFPAGLESIEDSAFANTGLTRADLSACTNLGYIGRFGFSNCDALDQVILPNGSGYLQLEQNAFQTAAATSLNLCIPSADMSLDIRAGEAFGNRIVTLYCDNAGTFIKALLEAAGIQGKGENGAIQVYPTTQFPGGYGQTGQSLFGLLF